MGGTLKHNTKQKQEGQYDTMEKSPASTMKPLSWCGIGSGCRGPFYPMGGAPPSECLMDLDLQPNKDGARC